MTASLATSRSDDSPWYIKLMLGISGWFASLFLFGFLGLGFLELLQNILASLVTGLVLVGIAWAILRSHPNDFLEHLALAISLAGQALVIWSIFRASNAPHTVVPWLVTAVFQLVLIRIMPDFLHRVFSTLVASYALGLTLMLGGLVSVSQGLFILLTGWVWLKQSAYPQHGQLMRAAGFGLALNLISMSSVTVGLQELGTVMADAIPASAAAGFSWFTPWLSKSLAALASLAVVAMMLIHYQQPLTHKPALLALGGALFVAAVAFVAPGLNAGLIVLLMGVHARSRVMAGLGLIALLYFMSRYYYFLGETLLFKSASLLVLGLLMLLGRWLFLRWLPRTGEGGAHG
ncbi:DUF4401 domain-containing protein [Allohahella marinimesophila]|uniref:DUF4401 domain-containing protein n=1 Tax=Allohahella marinimesophila TaxID=1054972 RepID=A0ABP7P9H2_9GAMM